MNGHGVASRHRAAILAAAWIVLAGSPAPLPPARGNDEGRPEPKPEAVGPPGFSSSDLEAYRRALDETAANDSNSESESGSKTATTAPPRVGFADLWRNRAELEGRRVTIEGRLARRFRQPSIADFPPLAEAWIMTRPGEPVCVVHPIGVEDSEPGPGPGANRGSGSGSGPAVGSRVRFTGRFLRLIQYEAEDGPRYAPLLVGGDPPRAVAVGPDGAAEDDRPFAAVKRGIDAILAVCLAGLVGLLMLRVHFLKPIPPRRRAEPPPEFVDGDGCADPTPDPEGTGSGRPERRGPSP